MVSEIEFRNVASCSNNLRHQNPRSGNSLPNPGPLPSQPPPQTPTKFSTLTVDQKELIRRIELACLAFIEELFVDHTEDNQDPVFHNISNGFAII
jgi:hypothetical protein